MSHVTRRRTPRLGAVLEAAIALRAAGPRAVSRRGWSFSPINVLVEVTYRCNLRCNFCHYLDFIEKKAEPLGPVSEPSLDDMERFIANVPRGRLVSFAGGEAFVRREFRGLLDRTSRTHRTHVITNGTLLSNEIAEHLVDLAPRHRWQRGLVLLCVSLQGTAKTNDRVVARPGSWEKTVAGVNAVVTARKRASKEFPKINLKMVVTNDTVGDVEAFVRLGVDLGVDVVNLMVEHSDETHSGVISGAAPPTLFHEPVTAPSRIDLDHLRIQLVRAYSVAEQSGMEIRTTPPNLPIEEFVDHYRDRHAPDPAHYRCTSPWSRVGLMADGRYVACPFARFGDVTVNNLDEVWNGSDMRLLRTTIRDEGVQPGCSGCCNLQYVGPLRQGLDGVDGKTVEAVTAAPTSQVTTDARQIAPVPVILSARSLPASHR